MLIRSLGRLHLYTASSCTTGVPEALWRRGVATGITQSALTVSSARLTLSGRFHV